MTLDSTEIMRRLAYIRYLHHLGVEQARLPEPMSSAAVLMFHDAVESFLLLAGEHLGAPSVYEFEKYWDFLSSAKLVGGVDLPVQQGMKRLNQQRKIVKHHGGHPSQTTINLIKDDAAAFLVASSQLVFNVDYDTVNLASVIPQDRVRISAERADKTATDGDRIEAMINLVEAWIELWNPWPRTPAVDGASPFRFDSSVSMFRVLPQDQIADYLRNESAKYPRRGDDIARQLAATTEIALALRDAARLTAIGVDFAAYQRFQLLTPEHADFMNGRRAYRAPEGYAPTADDVAFCLQLVVTTALRLAAAEAQLQPPPWLSSNPQTQKWIDIKEIDLRERQGES